MTSHRFLTRLNDALPFILIAFLAVLLYVGGILYLATRPGPPAHWHCPC